MKNSAVKQLSEQYLAALETHFAQGPCVGLQAAHDLGRTAVSIGLETLDLAKIHERALLALHLPDYSPARWTALVNRASVFFTEAILPIEETHRAALEASSGLTELNAALVARTLDLADSRHALRTQITGRTRAEAALRHSERLSSQLLTDSRNIEQQLQQIARQILVATEIERKKMSHLLNDEIAQNLLGIHIRLLALKREVTANHANLGREIAITQLLLEDSVKLLNRLAHQFSTHNE